MRSVVLPLLFVACSSEAPVPEVAAGPATASSPAPTPRAEIPPKACEPLAAADDATLVHLEGLGLACNDALADADIDIVALEASVARGQPPARAELERANAGCAAFLAEVERSALSIAGCRKSDAPSHQVNPLLTALRVVSVAAWDRIDAHRYDDAAKLLSRAIRASVMVGRSDDTTDIMVASRIGALLAQLQPLQTKVLPATLDLVRVDLAAAVAHLVDPEARIHLVLTHAVRLGTAARGDTARLASPNTDVAAPLFGAAAAEVLTKIEADEDWRALHDQAKAALAAAPTPTIKGDLDTLTPDERAYLARQSKVAVLDLVDAIDRNLAPVETLLRKTQAAW